MRALDRWKRLDLTGEARSRLDTLLAAERECELDAGTRAELLEAFMGTLTESQLTLFARMVRELTQPVH